MKINDLDDCNRKQLEIDIRKCLLEKPGRNDPCPCGSGKKYKKCHLNIIKTLEQTYYGNRGEI